MKIALLADIHSNYKALRSVLDELKESDVELVIFLGDYIFGGVRSNEVVDLIMNYDDKEKVVIRGNIEDLIYPIEEKVDWIYPVNHDIYNALGFKRIEYLKSLPEEITLNIQGYNLRICHNPSKLNMFEIKDDIIRALNTPHQENLKIMAANMKEDICIFGHYHLPMYEKILNKYFICPGSIGLPFNGQSNTQYSLLEIESKSIKLTNYHVSYDLDSVIDDFYHSGFYEKYKGWSKGIIKTLKTGHCYT